MNKWSIILTVGEETKCLEKLDSEGRVVRSRLRTSFYEEE